MALTVTVDQPGSSLLDAALTYAGFGWHVFPVRLDKKPFTRHGFKDAASDPGIVRRCAYSFQRCSHCSQAMRLILRTKSRQ